MSGTNSEVVDTENEPEVSAMEDLLRRTTPEEWESYMGNATWRLSTMELQSLLHILQKLGMNTDASNTHRYWRVTHCVRCHKSYMEGLNWDGACHIEHLHCDPIGRFQRLGNHRHLYTCKSCGEEVVLDDKAGSHSPDVCYSGLHTADEGDVRYDQVNTLVCGSECEGCLGKQTLSYHEDGQEGPSSWEEEMGEERLKALDSAGILRDPAEIAPWAEGEDWFRLAEPIA
ncbi:hypothetical protein NM688_g8433 [Phlebia brevispora]|uniref:Uncharacterized protein n=1 Tax=Phlebia brevispora TaxID=194682 RepID=A0ACC1RTV1_9APHY|nr:hypothetical protein NM688_g8433 [Phlebia brevispora]